MASLNAGWNVPAASVAGFPAVALKPAQSGKQHIIYAVDAEFSAAPSAPVLLTIVNPDVSPNTVYWQGFVPVTNDLDKTFPKGVTIEPGAAVAAVLSANGSLVGRVNLHGVTV